jgi:hypothetical protein
MEVAGEEEPPDLLSSPTLALTKKSPKIAGGVFRLGGSGPFLALIRTGPLGIRNPGGELENALADLDGGDADLALDTPGADDGVRRSHDLAAASGKPILPQNSSKSTARSRSPIRPIGRTLDSPPSHPTPPPQQWRILHPLLTSLRERTGYQSAAIPRSEMRWVGSAAGEFTGDVFSPARAKVPSPRSCLRAE